MAKSDQRIDELEAQIAFLEQSQQEISDALYAQQQRMDQQEKLIESLQNRLDLALQSAENRAKTDQDKPPHY